MKMFSLLAATAALFLCACDRHQWDGEDGVKKLYEHEHEEGHGDGHGAGHDEGHDEGHGEKKAHEEGGHEEEAAH